MSEITVEIESEVENKLLKRRELILRVHHTSSPTPERDVVKSKVASLTGFDKDKIVISSIESEFGRDESRVSAKLYESKEEARKYEREYILTRNKLSG